MSVILSPSPPQLPTSPRRSDSSTEDSIWGFLTPPLDTSIDPLLVTSVALVGPVSGTPSSCGRHDRLVWTVQPPCRSSTFPPPCPRHRPHLWTLNILRSSGPGETTNIKSEHKSYSILDNLPHTGTNRPHNEEDRRHTTPYPCLRSSDNVRGSTL